MVDTAKPIVWCMSDALIFVRDLQPKLHAIKWHVAMGGGVLNRGQSGKDLDLYFLPFGNVTTDPILPTLTQLLGAPEPISAKHDKYLPDANYAAKVKFVVDGKRIDAFIGRHEVIVSATPNEMPF